MLYFCLANWSCRDSYWNRIHLRLTRLLIANVSALAQDCVDSTADETARVELQLATNLFCSKFSPRPYLVLRIDSWRVQERFLLQFLVCWHCSRLQSSVFARSNMTGDLCHKEGSRGQILHGHAKLSLHFRHQSMLWCFESIAISFPSLHV